MIRTMITTVSVVALAAGAAFAQQEQAVEAPAYTTAATLAPDAHAVTTLEDAKTFAKAEFAMIDVNGDAKIEKAEFIAAAEMAQAKEQMAKVEGATEHAMVAEGDGVETAEQQFIGLAKAGETVSEGQLVDARTADFNEADADHSGALDEAEKARFAEIVKFGDVA